MTVRFSHWLHVTRVATAALRALARSIVTCLCVALLLSACGGAGDGSINLGGGVGSGGSGIAEGAVTGFGSVIVDGIEYDDTDATREVGSYDGKASPAEVKLGQRVRVEQSQAGKASRILVVPQLKGPVTQALSGGFLKVLDQWVQVVESAGTGNAPTVLDGYPSLAAIAVSDAVEVHGAWVNSGGSQGFVLVATRIEKLPTSPAQYLVGGTITRRNGNDLTLNAASGIEFRSSSELSASLQSDSQVSLWISSTEWSQVSAGAGRVSTLRVEDGSPALASRQVLKLGIPVRQSDVKNGKLTVQGLVVQVSATWLAKLPSGEREFVQLEVLREGDTYVLQGVQSSSSGALPGEKIELKGAIAWPLNPASLRLRDTTVSVPSSSISSSCKSLAPGALVFVEVKASRAAPGSAPVAISVQCQTSIPGSSIREVTGVLQVTSPPSQRISVMDGGKSVPLVLSPSSVVPANLADWNGREVEAQYLTLGDTNVLRQIKLER